VTSATAGPPGPEVGRPTVPWRRLRPLVAPLAAGGAVLLAAAAAGAAPPAAMALVPPCPLHALTGLWCPLCGGTRAVAALGSGDVGAAVAANVLVVLVAVPVAAVVWVRWVVRRHRDSAARVLDPSTRTLALAAALLGVFAVLRNLPAGQWFAP
jgi:hypothetical protein